MQGVAGLAMGGEPAAPPIAPEPGLWTRLMEPGKLDFHYRHLTATEESRYNAFLWTPMFRGGGGFFSPDDLPSVSYGGGYLRPLAAWPDLGDLILGGGFVDGGPRQDYEFQAEYRLPMGLGIGGGFFDTENPATDVAFGKLTYRNKIQSWSYILELQIQEFGDETSPGGYAAIYNDEWMFVGGIDGEQWRVTAGYIAPESTGHFRPAAELIYVDNSIGDLDGPRSWFGNLTLGYEGGFLSHPARLGRAMGPQGLEFGNPLGFLLPTWNRRLEVWELGGLAGARAERIEFPNGSVTERYEGLVFPFQPAQTGTFLDGLFIGGAYIRRPTEDTMSCLAGYFGPLKPFKVFAGVEYEFEPSETMAVAGVILPF